MGEPVSGGEGGRELVKEVPGHVQAVQAPAHRSQATSQQVLQATGYNRYLKCKIFFFFSLLPLFSIFSLLPLPLNMLLNRYQGARLSGYRIKLIPEIHFFN